MNGMLKKLTAGVSVLLVLLAAGALVFQDQVYDAIKLRGYTPPPAIVKLADDTTMQSGARRLFYVNHPVIADRQEFNEHCRKNEHSIVLGCYLSGQRGIYVLHVTDERLQGIQEVTAAHELLHAVYERLSSSEQQRIDSLTAAAFDALGDTRIKETIELYRKQDPSIVPNELHSILGSEARNLPAELEEHYARYFKSRERIVAYAEGYEQAFVERRNAIRSYDAELETLRAEIDALTATVKDEEAQLRAMRTQMDGYRSSNQTAQYNAMVPQYNSRVNTYNADIDRLSGLIVKHNDIVQKRNNVAAEEAELVEAIDSRDVVPMRQ